MGKESKFTLEEDYALVYSVWTKGHKNWGVHLADLQNNKHLFVVLDKEYEGERCSSLHKGDQLRNRYNSIAKPKSKYQKTTYEIKPFTPTAELKRQAAQLLTQQAKDQFMLEKEQQHAKDETYIKQMWDFIKETTPKIEKKEFLNKGSTDQSTLSVEELKLKQVAENEAKKAAHREKLQKIEELHDSTIKWRKRLETSLTEHRAYMNSMVTFMSHSIVLMRQTCLNDYHMSEEQYEKELNCAFNGHKDMLRNLVAVEKDFTAGVDAERAEEQLEEQKETQKEI